MDERPKKRVCFRPEQPDIIDTRKLAKRPLTLDIASVKATVTPYLFNQTQEPVVGQLSDKSSSEDEEIVQELERINSLITELNSLKVTTFTDLASEVKPVKKNEEKAFVFEEAEKLQPAQFDFTKQAKNFKEEPPQGSSHASRPSVTSPSRRRPFKGHRAVYCPRTHQLVKK